MKWAHLLDKAIRQDQGSPSTFGQRHDAAHSRIKRCVTWAAGIEAVEQPDASHAVGLLCARRERPRRRAAEQRDELAAFHSITSSARATSVGGMLSPNALAVLRLMILVFARGVV